jgi:lambda family phage portal protein
MRNPFKRKQSKSRGSGIQMRGFAAAQVDRLLAAWRFDGGFTPSEISSFLSVIRGRSRQMAKDNPHLKRYLKLSSVNIVGEGFALNSTPHDGTPGSDDYRLDESAAAFIEYHWKRFCTHRDPVTGLTWCDATGRKTDSEIDRLNSKTWLRDGEYFIHVIRNAPNPYGIAWRVLRPDWCDHTFNVSALPSGNVVQCGVEMNKTTRRPVAYYFCTVPDAATTYSSQGQALIRIPVEDIIHGFTQEDEDQPRGIPHTHASLVKLKMLDELDTAELTAARDEACSVRTYYAPPGTEGAVADLTDKAYQDTLNAMIAEKEPGQAEVLPLGWKQEVHTPKHPNREHDPFKRGMLKDVSCGFGVEYSNFTNDWASVSFSSVRVGTISERDDWICLQNDMISQCKSPQFVMWLQSFLRFAVSEKLPMAKIDKFAEHQYRGRRWMWVDPMRDMAAAVVAVDHGWKTNTQVASDMGTDFADNVDEIKRETTATAGTALEKTPENSAADRAARILSLVVESEKENDKHENQKQEA